MSRNATDSIIDDMNLAQFHREESAREREEVAKPTYEELLTAIVHMTNRATLLSDDDPARECRHIAREGRAILARVRK